MAHFDGFLNVAGLSRQDFLNAAGIKYTTVNKWNDKDRLIPDWVESWLKNYIKAKEFDSVVEAVKPYIKS